MPRSTRRFADRRTVVLPRPYDLAARGLVALVFFASGVNRVFEPAPAVEALSGAGLPAPEVLNAATAAVELVGAACLVLGLRVWAAALALALYLIPFAFVLHALPAQENALHGLLFARELAIVGALVLIAGVHRTDPRGGSEPPDPKVTS
jgi:uncharacterized membrane protein YphA (DoxX/SURF4 family)